MRSSQPQKIRFCLLLPLESHEPSSCLGHKYHTKAQNSRRKRAHDCRPSPVQLVAYDIAQQDTQSYCSLVHCAKISTQFSGSYFRNVYLERKQIHFNTKYAFECIFTFDSNFCLVIYCSDEDQTLEMLALYNSYSLIPSFLPLFIHSFIHLFIHSFIHSLNHFYISFGLNGQELTTEHDSRLSAYD